MNNKKIIMPQDEWIYYPSFSSGNSRDWLLKNFPIDSNLTGRFYDPKFKDVSGFYHPYFLLSAGHCYKHKELRKNMGLEDSLVFGDSGGYQIATGAIKWDFKMRDQIFEWLENNSDVAMNIDFPPFPGSLYEHKFDEALKISKDNFQHFEKNQSGKTKFLNVLQTRLMDSETLTWYDNVKDFNFKGWGIGGCRTLSKMMYQTALFLDQKIWENPNNEILHYLGITDIKSMIYLSILQKEYNKKFGQNKVVVSVDSSSPHLATIYGGWYLGLNIKTLSLNSLSLAKKNSYDPMTKLPCFEECPVCKGKNMEKLEEFKTLNSYLYMTCHNLCIFLKIIKQVTNIFKYDDIIIKDLLSKDVYESYCSIQEMFNSDNPMAVYKKYKQLYSKINLDDVFVSEEKINEFFDIQ